MPIRLDEFGLRAFGPGIFDMKASLVVTLETLNHLKKNDVLLPRGQSGFCSLPMRSLAVPTRAD